MIHNAPAPAPAPATAVPFSTITVPDGDEKEHYEEDDEDEDEDEEGKNYVSKLFDQVFQEDESHMVCRVLCKNLKSSSIFNTHLLTSLPKDITFISHAKSNDFGREWYEDQSDDDDWFSVNIRCATKLPHEPVDKYKHIYCKCNDNPACKISLDTIDYYHCPAAGYNGSNLVACQCEENLVTKLVKDINHLYELNNIDILINSIDDMGGCMLYHIVIIDKHITIRYLDGFCGI